jgi:hypothetical protein
LKLAGEPPERLVAPGIRRSSAWRDPADNAHLEVVFHSLQVELLHGTRFTSVDALRRALQRHTRYCNQHR